MLKDEGICERIPIIGNSSAKPFLNLHQGSDFCQQQIRFSKLKICNQQKLLPYFPCSILLG